jgi:hypothetical protein
MRMALLHPPVVNSLKTVGGRSAAGAGPWALRSTSVEDNAKAKEVTHKRVRSNILFSDVQAATNNSEIESE